MRTLPSVLKTCLIAAAAVGVFSLTAAPQVGAQGVDGLAREREAAHAARRDNAVSVGVISGGVSGTYIKIAADLAAVLDGDALRILPVVGRGSLQNLKDIMFLRGIDIGIVQLDARQALKVEGLQDEADRRLRYIAKLYSEEVHLLASSDITDIRQLEGKSVNIDVQGSGTNLTARIIFSALGLTPTFTSFDQASGYERLRRGEIQAVAYVAGRPVRSITEFREPDKFHLLSIPFEGPLADNYLPVSLTAADYPGLIRPEESVKTLAVGSILAVFNWPERSDRYNRIQRFVDAFFSRFSEFQKPGRHPKWTDVNLTATAPGWRRFKGAQDWLDMHSRNSAIRP
ncbi:TAXI family TRAP transporter solute-binding subunit [Alsobacter sp. KACC 23698]|uniref:TAXI family TRAP transporter solute-binding subunit n=1 Tax=Alsobacter sp. KACC 23698 TaxID=3149229 RepID=A0AAU7JJD1_9HYPH